MSMSSRYPVLCFLLFWGMVFAAAGEKIHIVGKGETIYSIARAYSASRDEIVKLNGIADPSKLQVGQRLRIPDAARDSSVRPAASSGGGETAGVYTEYTVAKGDTFYSLARRYEVSLASLLAENKKTDKSILREGEVLRIPGKFPAASPSRPAAVSPNPGGRPETRPPALRNMDASVRWPVNAKEVSYLVSKINGVMLWGERAESVKSLTQGTVISAGPYRKFGKVAIIQRSGGYNYVYGGCESLSVKVGDRVSPGMELGKLGIDATSGKPQLFFWVFQNNVPVDPSKAPRS